MHEWVEVVDRPFVGGPGLPAKMSQGGAWPARTKAWWGSVSSMPHCALWKASDWEFALDTALVHAWVSLGNFRMAGELRNREKVLGTTVDARRGLRVRYVEPEPVAGLASVAAIDDYKDL